jgi:ubiquinone biosynthesis protein
VVIPAVHEPLSTEFVLVAGWLDGVSLRTAGPLIDQRGLDRAQLARSLLHGLLYQITEGGVFHADPHPGNILLLADGRLALLDLGSAGRLDAQLRSSLQELLLAIGRGDPTALCDALLDLLTRPEQIDEQQLERALGQFMAIYFAGGTAPAADMFADLVRLITRFRLPIPAEIATVFRALGTLEGTLAQLVPGFDIAAEARQYATAHLAGRFSPESVGKTAADELLTLLPVLRRLPRRLDRVTSAMEQGRLSVNVRLLADERDRRMITGLTHMFLQAVIGVAIGVVAAILLTITSGPKVTPGVTLLQVIGGNLLIAASILVLQVLFTIFRSR